MSQPGRDLPQAEGFMVGSGASASACGGRQHRSFPSWILFWVSKMGVAVLGPGSWEDLAGLVSRGPPCTSKVSAQGGVSEAKMALILYPLALFSWAIGFRVLPFCPQSGTPYSGLQEKIVHYQQNEQGTKRARKNQAQGEADVDRASNVQDCDQDCQEEEGPFVFSLQSCSLLVRSRRTSTEPCMPGERGGGMCLGIDKIRLPGRAGRDLTGDIEGRASYSVPPPHG